MSRADAFREEVFSRPWAWTPPAALGISVPFTEIRGYLANIERAYYAGPWR